ncbi:hypothetical protein B0T16DRAFT_67729 [Cercophora newfieldiana]|uniref:Uncharacterized protein n=1 Tax=Cercophora newfieldiana TaxID=92897 RepID=A0AA39YTK3_9PEZI|nr:hypothetical protein B0T16DRAFT_67729 [Cercophora newfieldiana]
MRLQRVMAASKCPVARNSPVIIPHSRHPEVDLTGRVTGWAWGSYVSQVLNSGITTTIQRHQAAGEQPPACSVFPHGKAVVALACLRCRLFPVTEWLSSLFFFFFSPCTQCHRLCHLLLVRNRGNPSPSAVIGQHGLAGPRTRQPGLVGCGSEATTTLACASGSIQAKRRLLVEWNPTHATHGRKVIFSGAARAGGHASGKQARASGMSGRSVDDAHRGAFLRRMAHVSG